MRVPQRPETDSPAWVAVLLAGAAALSCGPAGEIRGVLETADGGSSLSGLSSDGGPVVAPPPMPAPGLTTLAEIQDRIFTPSCTAAGCHAPPMPALDLDLTLPPSALATRLLQTSKQSLAATPLITPGSYGASYLYLKVFLETPVVGDRMPPGMRLDDMMIDGLKRWIAAGAP